MFTLRALTPYLALQVQSQTPTNTSMGAWPGVFISTADTLSRVTRLLTCGHVLLPGVWPAVHGSHRIRVVTAAHLMGIGGEAERQGRRACPFLPTGSPPHVHCSAKGESENAVVTVTPFSWASWGAGTEMALGQQRAAGDQRLWLIAQLKGLLTAARNRGPEQGLTTGQGAWRP